MTSHSGTNKLAQTDNDFLDHTLGEKAICRILKVCKASGVSELKLGGLKVRFHPLSPTRLVEQPSDDFPEFADSNAPDSAPDRGNGLPVKVDKDLAQRMAEEQMLLDSPVAFENEQIDLLLGRSTGQDEDS